jgi:wyosine [tRNA(Phe)-imidazoG37] synthetase (radical SAM superfamily)
MNKKIKLKRIVMEVFGGCNYTCQMCPQSNPGRGKNFTRKMKLTEFERILDMIVPKYGTPQINLEGSGEPTMAKDLAKYVSAVKKRNLKCFMYCNGARLNGQFMQDVIDAGIDFIRVSVIGYNKDLYKKWMNVDNFDLIINNLKEIKDYIKKTKSHCQLSTYHLVTDNNKVEYEIEEYKKNVVNKININKSYIWRMHNWSGNYDNQNPRSFHEKASCGRPFAPEITIRAGGEAGRSAAMVPCCQTLGPPNEEKSILGHLDKENFEQVYFGEKYEKLRDAHTRKAFDEIDYCKNCDFLFQSKEILAWTNDKEAKLNNMLGTGEDFILTEFNKNKLS